MQETWILSLFFAILLTQAVGAQEHQEARGMKLYDFDGGSNDDWSIVNDGVMGGRSQGFAELVDGALRFRGTLVTRGGGFTSVRVARDLDLSGYEGLELRVRGIGRRFEVEVRDGTRYGWRNVSRRAAFPTSEEWQTVRVPFSALKSTVFGRPVSAPPLDPSTIRGIGLYILDGIDGPFWIEVDEIRAYPSD